LGSSIDDAKELKDDPFFQDVDWVLMAQKKVEPPFKPNVLSVLDLSNFDKEFTDNTIS